MSDSNDWHWRNSMRPTRFFAFDSRAVLGVVLVIIHIRLWTIVLACIGILVFWFAERAGYSFDSACRRLRTLIIGPKRPSTAFRSKTRLVDYGK
jgi:intracellular multiplication protein IcmT